MTDLRNNRSELTISLPSALGFLSEAAEEVQNFNRRYESFYQRSHATKASLTILPLGVELLVSGRYFQTRQLISWLELTHAIMNPILAKLKHVESSIFGPDPEIDHEPSFIRRT